jgi:ferritin
MYSKTVEEALNKQINAELYSSYLYYSMSAWAAASDYPGMSNWFKLQALEELLHVSKFFGYINDRGGRVKLGAVDAPPTEWESPVAAFSETLSHEKMVTGLINDLVNLAVAEKDRTTESFLQWFVNEQIEEEATASELLGKIKMIGDNGAGLYMIDQELASRVFTPPATGI